MSRIVQSPVKWVIYSSGLTVRSSCQARQASQSAGARQTRNTGILTHRRLSIGLVVFLQVHAGIQAGHLLAVAVEDLGRMVYERRGEALLLRLTPPGVIHRRIHIRIETVLLRVRHVPGG